MTKVAEMVQGVTDSVIGLGLSMIAEEWESMIPYSMTEKN